MDTVSINANCTDYPQSSKPDTLAIVVQSSMLRSGSAKKKPTAHENGLSSESANAVATTFADRNTSELTGRTE